MKIRQVMFSSAMTLKYRRKKLGQGRASAEEQVQMNDVGKVNNWRGFP